MKVIVCISRSVREVVFFAGFLLALGLGLVHWHYTGFAEVSIFEVLVQLRVFPDGKHDMPGLDSHLAFSFSFLSSKQQHLTRDVLKDSGQKDWCPSTYPLCIAA